MIVAFPPAAVVSLVPAISIIAPSITVLPSVTAKFTLFAFVAGLTINFPFKSVTM